MGERRARFEAREAFFASTADVTPYVAVEVGDEVFFVATEDRRGAARLCLRKAQGHLVAFGLRLAAERS